MMIDLLIFALIPEKNTFLFSGSITMTSTQNFAPERRATVKPSDTMRCRVSACSRLNIQHTRTVRHLQKKDDFQKIMAPNFFCWIFWEAIFLVDETPHGFNGVVFLKIGWSRIPQLQPQVNIIAGKVVWKQRFMRRFGCFWGRFLGTLRDSKALGRFFFFFEIWGFLEFWKKIPGFFEFTKGGGHGFIGPYFGYPQDTSTRRNKTRLLVRYQGDTPQGRRIWLRHVSFGKLDKRKETPIRRQESSNESCERGPIGPFSFFSELIGLVRFQILGA